MSAYVIIFLLFLLQFFYFPVGMSFFEGAKAYLVEVLIFLLLLLQLFSKEGIIIQKYNKQYLWAIGVLFTITIYHLIFHQTENLLFGNEFRLQGTFLIWMLAAFAFVSSWVKIENKIHPVFVSAVLFVQLVCTVLFIGVGTDRPVGTLGEPNALAASVVFMWPFLIFAWPKKVPLRIIATAGLMFAFIILFVSGSRSGLIALGVQVCFFGLTWLFDRRLFKQSKKRLLSAVLISIIVLLISFITPFIGPRSEYEDRGEIWKAAIYAGAANPIQGVGFGNAEYEYHRANVELGNKLPGYYVDSAHNLFLDWFVQAGIVGLGVLLFLLFKTFKRFISTGQTRNIILLLGLISALSFNPASVVSLIGLWWLIGQGSNES